MSSRNLFVSIVAAVLVLTVLILLWRTRSKGERERQPIQRMRREVRIVPSSVLGGVDPDPRPEGSIPPRANRAIESASGIVILTAAVLTLVALPLILSGDSRWYTGSSILALTGIGLLIYIIILLVWSIHRGNRTRQIESQTIRLERKLNKLLENVGIDPDSI